MAFPVNDKAVQQILGDITRTDVMILLGPNIVKSALLCISEQWRQRNPLWSSPQRPLRGELFLLLIKCLWLLVPLADLKWETCIIVLHWRHMLLFECRAAVLADALTCRRFAARGSNTCCRLGSWCTFQRYLTRSLAKFSAII